MALVLGLAPALAGQAAAPRDPLADLAHWTRRLGRQRAEPGVEELGRLERLVADVRLAALDDPQRREAAAGVFLDLSIATPLGADAARDGDLPSRAEPGSPLASVREMGRRELRGLLRGGRAEATAAWLAASVLARAASEPPERRAAAARALRGLHLAPARLALFTCAIDPDRRVRAAAQEALVGWPDEGVHRFLLTQADRGRERLHWIAPSLVREHFNQVELPLGGSITDELARRVQADLRGGDWRAAYRAIQLGAGLPDAILVPALIAALRDWQLRRAAGQGRLRLEGDLVADLRRRSGRNIGPHPERWTTWWRAHTSGSGGAAEGDSPASPGTSAGFFGLRPLTDRVVFVLDRSGSMDYTFRASGRTRYEEAVVQLMALLESLGPQARFRVILFSGGTRVWSQELRAASPANLAAVEAWMRYRGPDGATHLEPAVRDAVGLDGRGRLDLESLEADTVIVLCDGETAEGPGWVPALLEGPNEQAALIFHCVQIGGGSDGTLELLARGTGGDFVAVPD